MIIIYNKKSLALSHTVLYYVNNGDGFKLIQESKGQEKLM